MSMINHIEKTIKENSEIKIALRMLHLRQDNNITSGQFAEIIGVSQSVLSGYERGENSVPASLLLVVSKIFDIDIEYFYQNDNKACFEENSIKYEKIANVV